MTPKVSIGVPNLNTRLFLPERFETIFKQTFQDWKLLVYDGYSVEGAWEYIQGLAQREPKIWPWLALATRKKPDLPSGPGGMRSQSTGQSGAQVALPQSPTNDVQPELLGGRATASRLQITAWCRG
jgi:glycosyltransferase involved in cell wall biosynthesis